MILKATHAFFVLATWNVSNSNLHIQTTVFPLQVVCAPGCRCPRSHACKQKRGRVCRGGVRIVALTAPVKFPAFRLCEFSPFVAHSTLSANSLKTATIYSEGGRIWQKRYCANRESDNPLENATEQVTIHWKTPLKIH